MNANATMIVKRNGTKEPLNIDKIHKVVIHACEGLAGVSASQIEMNANLQFYDGMTTEEIQEILIRSANDLISLEAPNYRNMFRHVCCSMVLTNKFLVNTKIFH